MKVSFQDIAKGSRTLSVADTCWAECLPFDLGDTTNAKLAFSLENENTAEVNGSLSATIFAVCARCGVEVQYPVDIDFSYVYKLGRELAVEESEREFSDEESRTVFIEDPLIDIDAILEEQLILAVPEKLLCMERCKGLCYICGANLNEETCRCKEDRRDSPFSVLGKFKK